MKNGSIWIPLVAVALGAAYLVAAMVPPRDKGTLAIHEFGKLPAVAGGREKPFDTIARNTLMMISDRQSFYDDEAYTDWMGREYAGREQPATRWLLDVMAGSPSAADHKVFRIDTPDLLDYFGLEARTNSEHKFRYSHAEIITSAEQEQAFKEQVKKAVETPEDKRSLFQRKAMELSQQIQRYYTIQYWFEPLSVPPVRKGDEWQSLIAATTDSLRAAMELPPDPRAAQAQVSRMVGEHKDLVLRMNASGGTEQLPINLDPTAQKLSGILLSYLQHGALLARIDDLEEQIGKGAATPGGADALKKEKIEMQELSQTAAANFNSAIAAYRTQLRMAMPETITKADREFFFNDFAPFYRCMVLYVLAFVLVLIGLLRWEWGRTLNRAAIGLALLALAVHTFALILRMDLMDRWAVFVTNLYSSAVFIGWFAVVLCLILEWFFRLGIGTIVATFLGACSLLIAHNLAAGGEDTLEMMQAVLDTNFWLATHVTTVTKGYAATFVAGMLGIAYILLGVFTRRLDASASRGTAMSAGAATGLLMAGPLGAAVGAAATNKRPGIEEDLGKVLSRMIYAIICFAVLFSFVGTVLGGIWADQSWGRFWGWDPKENGALMIVLWNGLILHARWGGMIRQRGLAVMAVFGNIITAWSWFGVNELGAGLHSYGFTEGRAFWLMMFVLSQFILMGIGLIPQRFWRSFRSDKVKASGAPGAEPLPVPA